MADFALSILVGQETTLKLTLLDQDGLPFDLASFISSGGVPSFTMSLGTGSITTRVVSAASISVVDGDPPNLATVEIAAGSVTAQGVYSAKFAAGLSTWNGSVAASPAGSPITSGGSSATGPTQTVPEFTSTTMPEPGPAWLNRDAVLRDPGTPAQRMWCRRTIDGGGYEWIVVAY